MTTSKHNQVEWFKYDRPEFSCVERYLMSKFSSETDILTLAATTLFFHSLDEKSLRNQAFAKLCAQINGFVDIDRSGMQLRNCLAIVAYLYIKNKVGLDSNISSQIINSHLQYAEGRVWFNDPRLPAIVAGLTGYKQYASAAHTYLCENVLEWIKKDKAFGVLCYCIVERQNVSDEVLDYLRSINWVNNDLEFLAWALLAVSNLIDEGHSLLRIQYLIVEQIYEHLWESDIVRSTIGDRKGKAKEFTSFEIAFAVFALKCRGFDQYIGFPTHQEDVLVDLIQLRNKLLGGAVILSRRLFLVLQVAVLCLILAIVWFILQQLEIQDLYSVVLEILITGLLYGLDRWYFTKKQPAVEVLSEIFGAEMESPSEGMSDEQNSTP